jgi:hypothetical protein
MNLLDGPQTRSYRLSILLCKLFEVWVTSDEARLPSARTSPDWFAVRYQIDVDGNPDGGAAAFRPRSVSGSLLCLQRASLRRHSWCANAARLP